MRVNHASNGNNLNKSRSSSLLPRNNNNNTAHNKIERGLHESKVIYHNSNNLSSSKLKRYNNY